ncbi:hypothetical protein [Gordonia sp. NB41Y]|uniref:hypothetical protein n=1 Tax=Gordonia sp. NB41Y TaxID=875808 RepID=UPI0002BE06A7|nr:hypothetical protein [Gordonia sp. NB41Y]EMP11103.1 hypothetical protein ISGA_2880 [Gordonia sp. NB41Y]WLP88436.1 hypothetical protein Q9K23_12395 [Gordonia sp. NB41Y]
MNGGNLLWALIDDDTGRSHQILHAAGLLGTIDRKMLGLIEVGYNYGLQTQGNLHQLSTDVLKVGNRLGSIERRLGNIETALGSSQ